MPLNVSAAIGPLSPLGTNGRYNKKEKKKKKRSREDFSLRPFASESSL